MARRRSGLLDPDLTGSSNTASKTGPSQPGGPGSDDVEIPDPAQVADGRQGPPGINGLIDPRFVGPQPGPRSRRGNGGDGGQQGPQLPSMDEWNYQQQFGGGGAGGFGMPDGINYDDYQATTREVQDEELASWQLQQMLESDSPYMEQARRAGERAAAQRGALSSSIFAGSSQASAIQAAAPIAESDATAFRAAAGQNMQAQNQMSLAKLQSETGVLQSSIAASASVASSSIAANANKEIASMRIQSERDMAEFSAAQSEFMERLKQEGRMDLFEMDADLRERLQNNEFGHELTTMDVANEYALQQMGFQGKISGWLQNQQIMGGFLGSLNNNIFGSINTLSQLGLDEDGFQTGINNIWQTAGMAMNLFNYWNNEGQFPEIDLSGGGDAMGPPAPGGG